MEARMPRVLALLALALVLSGCESSGIRYIKKLAREKPLETRIFRDPRTKLLGIERSFDPLKSNLEGQPEAWEEVRLERRQVVVEPAFTDLVATQRAFYGRLPSAPTFTLVTFEGERIGATPFARCRSAVGGVLGGPGVGEWQLPYEPKAIGTFVDQSGWVGYYAPANAWSGRYTFAQSRAFNASLAADQARSAELTRQAKEREEAIGRNSASPSLPGPSPTQADTGAWDRYVTKQWLNGSSTGVYHNRGR